MPTPRPAELQLPRLGAVHGSGGGAVVRPLPGRVLVVKVGSNEGSQGYGAGIDRVMRAALADGVRGVVWVTLRETSPIYRSTNIELRKTAKRWPQLLVADWNAFSAGKPWFGSDGLHLSATGATQLASLLRPYVFRAASLRA